MNRKVELSEENYDLLDEAIHQLCKQGRLLEEQNAMQHGSTSVYEHSVNVAYKSLLLAENFRLPVDKQSLVRGPCCTIIFYMTGMKRIADIGCMDFDIRRSHFIMQAKIFR